MSEPSARLVVETLEPLVTAERAERIEGVLASRLGGISVLLENLYDQGNAVAIFRTCEALGVQNVHLIEKQGRFKVAKKIGRGAEKWLSIHTHDTGGAAVAALQAQGYRVIASSLEATTQLGEIDVSTPVAVIFGSERDGVSAELLAACDETYVIPMVGNSQSLNVSCAAAITLYDLTGRYRRGLGRTGDLEGAALDELRALFYRRSLRSSDLLLAQLGGDADEPESGQG
jgi:tRNA (guanosine-2'-O-)-methyltransferase